MTKPINPRIIAGKYKGRTLKVPDSARPVTDRVKTIIFDTLGDVIQGKSILDLFAGSGSLGIEALSRGAESGTFTERDEEASELLKQNLRFVEEPVKPIKIGYKSFLREGNEQFDIIFLDPPFAITRSIDLKSIIKSLKPSGLIVLRSDEPLEKLLEKYFNIVVSKTVGINYLYFLTLKNNS